MSPTLPGYATEIDFATADGLTFHLVHPEPGRLGPWDPNCAFFWKGRYHLFYIHPGEHGDAYAHLSSTDLVRWRRHPSTLTPETVGHTMWSGTGFITKEGRAAIIYQGAEGHGPGMNRIAFSDDDLLEEWTAPRIIEPRVRPDQNPADVCNWDPDGWLEGDVYYSIFGSRKGPPTTLHKSVDLENWDYVGPFFSDDVPEEPEDRDVTGPNFFPLGGKHVLLCISESDLDSLGSRYYIGEWKNERFTPEVRGRMNWQGTDSFAVESVLTADGRRVMWAWCPLMNLLNRPLRTRLMTEYAEEPQRGIQSLPRELDLPEDGVLRIRPLRELETLRADEVRRNDIVITDRAPVLLDGVSGDALELAVIIRPGAATRVGLRLHCDELGRYGVPIVVDRRRGTLAVGEVVAPFILGESGHLELRVFVDKHLIEVFADERQVIVASHPADPSAVFVALLADGADATGDVTAWRMNSIY